MISEILYTLGLLAACVSLVLLVAFAIVITDLPVQTQVKTIIHNALIGIVGALIALAVKDSAK